VVSEAQQLQTLYTLKREIRYGHERTTDGHTESVAEHIYALHCLVDYFLPLEDTGNSWRKLAIHEMIQYHDIGEIETGDIVAYKKTEADYEYESQAARRVIKSLPSAMQDHLLSIIDEFDKGSSIEAQFVRAIDKFEPLIHCFNKAGKQTLQHNKFTLEKRIDYTSDALTPFPILTRFEDVLNELFVRENYYYIA
jgi:5'-deoxynucleotidase YfbR-like HD superfamily hydrolase